jgi:hypothetical protein
MAGETVMGGATTGQASMGATIAVAVLVASLYI